MIGAIARPPVDWFAISPALATLGAAGLCLMVAVLVPERARRATAAFTAAAGFVTAFVLAAVLYDRSPDGESVIAAAVRRDRYAALAAIIVAGAGLVAVLVSYSERTKGHVAEFYALLSAAAGGMIFLASANNLMTLFLGLEWFSISLYILCAVDADRERSLEAGLKYLIVGGFGSAVLLFGSALVYGATGELEFSRIAFSVASNDLAHDTILLIGLAMVLAGLGFKVSAAPFHMWTPDVYEGAPTSVTAFMSAATKTAALVLTLRILFTAFPQEADLWTIAVAVIACASLAVGNLAALVQRNIKRLLAYSSISHAGFMLIAVASHNALGGRALLYYLIPYSAMSIGAFAVVAARERELGQEVTLDNLAGMGWERPLLGAAMWTFMLGFAGLPPTGGFLGKFYVFSAAYDHGWLWLVIVGVAATAVSLYYYLAVIRALYMRPSAELQFAAGGQPPRDLLLQLGVLACVAVAVGSFFGVQPLVDLSRHAFQTLPL
ncbi:MAG TPA: NADH-quinone oxidoreductase subunit N [Gaiellaceae bacterium]|nr:NADH-quinone oxidoreductase subunit N [Gaiellaceae bacterium]